MTEHPSPFLPGTNIQYAWDSTSLGWLKTCPRLYKYSMIDGYRLKAGGAVHLEFGGWYHSALEYYDKLRTTKHDHDEAVHQVVRYLLEVTWIHDVCPSCSGTGKQGEDYPCNQCDGLKVVKGSGKPWDLGHNLKTRPNLIRAVIWYLEHFQNDAAKTVILENGKPAVELSFRMELDYGPMWLRGADGKPSQGAVYLASGKVIKASTQPYILSGHLDRVVEFNGGLYVMDRKTASSTIGSYYFDQYNPDNQMSLYTLAARVIYSTPVQGVIIDAAQIAVGFSRFERGFTHRSDDQIEEWLDDTRQWLHLAENFATVGFWPMNDKSCHQYGGCAFRRVCSKSPKIRQHFLDTDFEVRRWNPLEPR